MESIINNIIKKIRRKIKGNRNNYGNRYHVDEMTNGVYQVVKTLNIYDTKKEADYDLISLATGHITEEELLNKLKEKNLL